MLLILLTLFVLFGLSIYLVERYDAESCVFGAGASLVAFMLVFFVGIGSYFNHARDLGIIRGQSAVIEVYQARVDQLDKRLDAFAYPEKGGIILNADSPVASIVQALAEAETSLARAKERQAEAIVSIAQRKAGPYSFIVDWVGEE